MIPTRSADEDFCRRAFLSHYEYSRLTAVKRDCLYQADTLVKKNNEPRKRISVVAAQERLQARRQINSAC